VSQVAIEDGVLVAIEKLMPHEGIGKGQVFTLRALLVGCVSADVAHQEIEQAIVVVIEEKGARGMRGSGDASFAGDVAEVPVAVVFEEQIAAAHGGHEQVGVTVVIDVRKSGGDADKPRDAYARLRGDVLELAAAKILPKLVAAGLAQEVDVV